MFPGTQPGRSAHSKRCNSSSSLNSITVPHSCLRGNLPVKRTSLVKSAAVLSRRVAPSEERQQHNRTTNPEDASTAARRASVKLPKLLSSQIAAASSLSHLHDILAAHGSRLNHIHVAKLLTRTSQFAAAGAAAATAASNQNQEAAAAAAAAQQAVPPQQDQLLQQQQHMHLLFTSLTGLMAQRARHATCDTLVAAVAAIGRLSSLMACTSATVAANGQTAATAAATAAAAAPSQQQLQQLAVRAQELQAGFSVSQVSVLCWGFAKAGLKPCNGWMDLMLEAFLQQYHLAHQEQQQQQQQKDEAAAVGATELPKQQSLGQQQQLLQRPVLPKTVSLQQQQQQGQQQWRRQLPHSHSLATDLALVMYAAAVMGQHPQQQLLLQWQGAVLQQLPAANSQDLAQTLWGLATLGQNPGGQQWLEEVLLASVPKLDRCGSQALANCIWAVERLMHSQQQQQQLPAAWIDAFLEALYTEPTLPCTPQALSCCLTCVSRLRLTPLDGTKLTQLLDASTASLNAFTPKQLTDTLWACASLNLRPSATWLKSFMTAAARAADAGRCSVQQLGSLIWSLALIKERGQDLLVSQQLQLRVMLQALAAAHQGQGLRQLGRGGTSGLAWALASLGLVPDRAWLGQFLTAAFDAGLAADQVRCASCLFCIAALDFDYLVEWLGDFLAGNESASGGSGGGGVDLSLQKYAALAGVLGALAEMDSKQLRAAWLEQTVNPEWTAEAASEGLMGSSMQLPASLTAWVDGLTDPAAAAAVSSKQ